MFCGNDLPKTHRFSLRAWDRQTDGRIAASLNALTLTPSLAGGHQYLHLLGVNKQEACCVMDGLYSIAFQSLSFIYRLRCIREHASMASVEGT